MGPSLEKARVLTKAGMRRTPFAELCVIREFGVAQSVCKRPRIKQHPARQASRLMLRCWCYSVVGCKYGVGSTSTKASLSLISFTLANADFVKASQKHIEVS
ncbi:hypothetical protein CBL_09326 [Carabus blaptoides fortunei]